MSILERHSGLSQTESQKRELEANIDFLLRLSRPIPTGDEVIKSKSLYLSGEIVKSWKDRPRIGRNDRMSPDELMVALRSISPYQPAYELEYDSREAAAILVPEIVDKAMRRKKFLNLHLVPQGIHETWTYRLDLNSNMPMLTYSGEAHGLLGEKSTSIQGGVKRASANDLAAFGRFLGAATSQH